MTHFTLGFIAARLDFAAQRTPPRPVCRNADMPCLEPKQLGQLVIEPPTVKINAWKGHATVWKIRYCIPKWIIVIIWLGKQKTIRYTMVYLYIYKVIPDITYKHTFLSSCVSEAVLRQVGMQFRLRLWFARYDQPANCRKIPLKSDFKSEWYLNSSCYDLPIYPLMI